MNRTIQKHQGRKAKRTFTLSPESVEFLEAAREKEHARSVSSVLDEIVLAARHEQESATLEQAVSDYYASLSDEEVEEQTNWGEFALGEFPAEGV